MFFTGTNTGNRYQAGKTYSNGNGKYTANADGTFTNQKTNRKTVGSSRDRSVSFFRSASSNERAGTGNVSARVETAKGGGGSGPGSAGVRTEGLFPWNEAETPPGEYETYGPTDLLVKQADHVKDKGRPLPMGTFNWEGNPNWPTGQAYEDEYGDLVAAPFIVGKFVFGDVPWNAARWSEHLKRSSVLPRATAFQKKMNAMERDRANDPVSPFWGGINGK